MLLRFILISALFFLPGLIFAQGTSGSAHEYPEGARPDVPGQLGVEFGMTLVPDFPDELSLNFIGTNTFSGYYKYDVYIPDSKFSFHPGVAITSMKYSFSNNVTLSSELVNDDYQTLLLGLDSIGSDRLYKKSLLKTTYFEVPLEFTFRTNQEFPKRSFKFTLGAKGGVLISSKTKVKFEQDNQNKVIKQKERYDLSLFKVTAVARIGYGSFNLFYNYSLLPVFEKNKGPLDTEANRMTFGISLDLF